MGLKDSIPYNAILLANEINAKRDSLLSWIIKNRPMLKINQPLNFKNRLFLVDLYRNTHPNLVIMKPAQIGLTEFGINYALYRAEFGTNVFYLFPSATHVQDLVRERFNPGLAASRHLQKIVLVNNIGIKQIKENFIFFRGGSENSVHSVPAGVMIMDEFDRIPSEITVIAEKRLLANPNPTIIKLCTPTYAGVGIHEEYIKSSQAMCHYKCQHCNQYQSVIDDTDLSDIKQVLKYLVFEWDDLKRPVQWYGKNEGKAYVVCEKCKKPLDLNQMPKWITKYPTRTETRGMLFSGLYCPDRDPMNIITRLSNIDSTVREKVIQQDLGLPYIEEGLKITHEIIEQAKERYDIQVTKQRNKIRYIGIDVGKTNHIVIREKDAGSDISRLIHCGILSRFKDIYDLIKNYSVQYGVIDSGPETNAASELQREVSQIGCQMWRCRYFDEWTHNEPIEYDYSELIVKAHRTGVCDKMVAFMRLKKSLLPMTIGNNFDYTSQLMAPTRVLKDKASGATVARWVEGNNPDHYFHAEVYAWISQYSEGRVWVRRADSK